MHNGSRLQMTKNLQLFIDAKENKGIAQNGTYRKVLGLHWFTENDNFKHNFTDIIKTHFKAQRYVLRPIRNDFTNNFTIQINF